jgi:hypothetical protein
MSATPATATKPSARPAMTRASASPRSVARLTLRQRADAQWADYAETHRSRANLWLHLVVVPVFLLAQALALWALVLGAWWTLALALAAMFGALGLQQRGHAQEARRPAPFASLGQAVLRLWLEQCVTFPRFVISGRWWQAVRATRRD